MKVESPLFLFKIPIFGVVTIIHQWIHVPITRKRLKCFFVKSVAGGEERSAGRFPEQKSVVKVSAVSKDAKVDYSDYCQI